MDGSQFFADSLVLEGRVKWFCPRKGYGFLVCDGLESDVLLHAYVLHRTGRRSIATDAIVEFEMVAGASGYRVEKIERVTCAAAEHDSQMINLPDDYLEPARVKWFDKKRNYGFVTVFGKSGECFLPGSALMGLGQDEVSPGEALAVAIGHGERGRVVLTAKPWL